MRIWVTREEPTDGPLSSALRARGLKPIIEPVIEKRVCAEPATLITQLTPQDWLILTSPFAIEVVGTAPGARIPRVGVVGRPSADLARSMGLRVELVSEDGHGKGLFDALRDRVNTGVVCYPRSDKADAPHAWADVELRSPVLYETCTRRFDRSIIQRVDVIAVASPSAVHAVGRVDKPFASIGRVTSQALRGIGVEPWVEANPPSFAALAAAIADRASGDANPPHSAP